MIQFNSEQQSAINKIKRFLDGGFPGENELCLNGAAGTGKTTILKEVIKEFPKSIVFGATVSHAAKNVLHKMAGDYMQCYTIDSLLGKKATINKNTGKRVFKPDTWRASPPPITRAKIIINDECSMTDKFTQEQIRGNITEGAFIIYCGDMYQLPPVVEGPMAREQEDSPTFKCKLQAILAQPVRYDEIIGQTAYFYRETINIFNHYGGINFANLFSWRPVMSNGKSSVEYTSDSTAFIYKALHCFKADRENTRMLAYRNITINELNAYLRKCFYPYHEDLFVKGEYIITNKPFGENVNNGEFFYISGVDTGYVHAPFLVAKDDVHGYDETEVLVKVYFLEIKRQKNSKEIIDELPVVHQDSRETFNEYKRTLEDIADKNKKWWAIYNQFLDEFADVSYTYATSTHKAQGQTIDNVFVLANDILGVKKTTLKVKLQSLYVATSRAKKNLTVLL